MYEENDLWRDGIARRDSRAVTFTWTVVSKHYRWYGTSSEHFRRADATAPLISVSAPDCKHPSPLAVAVIHLLRRFKLELQSDGLGPPFSNCCGIKGPVCLASLMYRSCHLAFITRIKSRACARCDFSGGVDEIMVIGGRRDGSVRLPAPLMMACLSSAKRPAADPPTAASTTGRLIACPPPEVAQLERRICRGLDSAHVRG